MIALPGTEIQKKYDLAFAWNWPYDGGFVRLLQRVCAGHHVSLLEVTPNNLDPVLCDLEKSTIQFNTFLDRAADSDAQFSPLCDWASLHCKYVFNPAEKTTRANNKALMHYALIRAGLQTPFTIILPSYQSNPSLPEIDLALLKNHFAIKPSHGGGSEGVVTDAQHPEQIQSARQQFPEDDYLLQATIHPANLEGKQAWFRVLYCCDHVYPCWWHTETHQYKPLSFDESSVLHLERLKDISRQIGALIELDLFSSEIAFTEEGQFVVVDYVNDPIDLRLQSEATDGVPDEIVAGIANTLADWVSHINPKPAQIKS
jgi:hypothetical protein